jgi:hypothetical protein
MVVKVENVLWLLRLSLVGLRTHKQENLSAFTAEYVRTRLDPPLPSFYPASAFDSPPLVPC